MRCRAVKNKILSIGAILLCFLHLDTIGQDMLGTVLGNYAGVNAIQVNPSALHNSKTYFDFELMGADLFLQNNYLFVARKDYRIGHFFQSGYQWPTHAEQYGTESRMFYSKSGKQDRNIFINLRIDGPGLMLIWKKHAFALTTDFRTIVSARNVPYEIANFSYLGLNYLPQQNINYKDNRPFKIAAISWAEIGLTYAYEIYANGFDKISAGISAKRLYGYAGMNVVVKNIDYVVPNDSTISVKNLNGEFGISLPVSYSKNSYNSSSLVMGRGFGFDVGVTYYRLARMHEENYSSSLCSKPYADYLYRLGISLIDVGAIKFTGNAEKYTINNRGSYWDNVNRIKFNSIQQIIDTLSYKFYGDPKSAYTDNKFYLWLPSALSIQFDYHYNNDWYINGSFIYGFNFSKNSITRPSDFSITPRYERDWFEADFPVSLYDWTLPRIGLSLRFYYLTIGTDKLGWFFHVNDLTGMDFYFTIKFFLKKGTCRSVNSKGCKEKNFQVKSKF